MKIYKTTRGILIEESNSFYLIKTDWDAFINRDDLFAYASSVIAEQPTLEGAEDLLRDQLLAPIGAQEIWGSGVTYFKSREARMEEAQGAGGGDFYDRVYHAERPEIFFKSNPSRAVGPFDEVRIRDDSNWNVPEPELTLLVSANAKIIGYTIGNDMSSRDIEGENPLYLPQAKTYDKSAAIGPCILVMPSDLPADSQIGLEIFRNGKNIFAGTTQLNQMKRRLPELVSYLYRSCSFPQGCLLMTGTGIVPPNEFTLDHGDEIRISIEHIGVLVNFVE